MRLSIRDSLRGRIGRDWHFRWQLSEVFAKLLSFNQFGGGKEEKRGDCPLGRLLSLRFSFFFLFVFFPFSLARLNSHFPGLLVSCVVGTTLPVSGFDGGLTGQCSNVTSVITSSSCGSVAWVKSLAFPCLLLFLLSSLLNSLLLLLLELMELIPCRLTYVTCGGMCVRACHGCCVCVCKWSHQ